MATFEPSFFSFEPPVPEGCTVYIKPSTSSQGKCEYATNGGFFSWDKLQPCKCEGNLVTNGHTFVLEGMARANYGITADNQLVAGFIDDESFNHLNFTHLMSGYGWLVRHGATYVDSSGDLDVTSNFVTEKAPRTTVGHFSNGTMFLFEVDGEEDIDYGPDLYEMAELLVELGVDSAVNIDGGGSSVSVFDGEVISEPTCDDTSTICERRVQSFTCVAK
jgi:N-acetylglucosamine-1-phosphodiester alpha-N-acetylglucosaminidase